MDRIHKRVNQEISTFMSSVSGFSFQNIEFESFSSGFFFKDKINLSDVGLDMLNLECVWWRRPGGVWGRPCFWNGFG